MTFDAYSSIHELDLDEFLFPYRKDEFNPYIGAFYKFNEEYETRKKLKDYSP